MSADGIGNRAPLPLFKSVFVAMGLAAVLTVWPGARQAKISLDVLAEIYAEVKELGPYPGEDFVRREFFVGKDDDDTNKDVHVVVLIQRSDLKETMTIRVTQMVRDPGNLRARIAGDSKMLVCSIAGGKADILSSDYTKEELDELAPEILTAIQNKKRLLKLGTGYPFPSFSYFDR